MMTSSVRKFQTSSGRRVALWGLVAILALLLALGAGAQGSGGAEEQGSPSTMLRTGRGAAAQSPISNIQSFDYAQDQSRTTSRTISYTYDAAGRLVEADYGEGQGIAYTYDDAGNLLRRKVTVIMKVYLPMLLKGLP